MADFYIAQGDQAPSIGITCTMPDGTVLNLAGATALFVWRLADLSRPGHSEEATVLSAEDGTLEYEWQEGDTDVPGLYLGRWIVTLDDGREISFPNNGHTVIQISRDP